MLFLFSNNSFADYQNQLKKVTGTVLNAKDKTPLPGATVVVKGTTNGTITDSEGKFTIETTDDATLLVSFISFQTTEMAVAGKS
ncbi:MAG: carboxypeptidase-like regulatory domain-containing protein, partial [Mangrovibacterium sp.]